MPATDPTAPHGLILDLDGTLVDTLDDVTSAVNHAVAEHRTMPWTRDDVRLMVGGGLSELLRRAGGVVEAEHEDTLVARFREYYSEHYLDRSVLYPGWAEVLDELDRRRVPMAVLSNKPDDFTRRICDRLLDRWRFVHVEGQRPGAPVKPDPTRALAMAALLDRPPDRVLFLGDAPSDVETARRAGMVAVAAAWGFRSRSELEAAHPEVILDTPGDLLRFFRQEGLTALPFVE
jgi:phosphoglycolate phosphatase